MNQPNLSPFSAPRFLLLATVLALMFSHKCAQADLLIMDNGDRLNGEIISKDGDTITFKTHYAEKIAIKWENVKELRADEEITVRRTDGQMTTTREIGGTNSPLSKADVDLINPDLWRIGKGFKFSGEVNVSLNFEQGNTEKDEYDFDWQLTLRDLEQRVRFEGLYENDSSNDIKTKVKGMYRQLSQGSEVVYCTWILDASFVREDAYTQSSR